MLFRDETLSVHGWIHSAFANRLPSFSQVSGSLQNEPKRAVSYIEPVFKLRALKPLLSTKKAVLGERVNKSRH